MPLIEKYIEEISKKNNTLLGVNISDKLTIQIDYDEEVFLMRPMLFAYNHNDNIGGYYNKKSNTIYLYTNNPINDVLMNMPQVSISEGNINISDNSFKDNLFHEYTHYVIDRFIENNNMDKNSLPVWFEEGILAAGNRFGSLPRDNSAGEGVRRSLSYCDARPEQSAQLLRDARARDALLLFI